MIWFCIMVVLSTGPVMCDGSIDTSRVRVFPAANRSIAGVFMVSHINDVQQLQYAFDTSEAREICQSLGVNIASKSHVQQALTRGLETCRFGWTDEHFAVIPRINAASNCGQNKTGLVTWRASVTQKFDVFCFNESVMVTQLENITDRPVSQTLIPSEATVYTDSTSQSYMDPFIPDSSSNHTILLKLMDNAKSTRAKTVLIICSCAVLLVFLVILAYIKLKKRRWPSSDVKQEECMETEDCKSMKTIKETTERPEEQDQIDVCNDAS
ncbi:lymphatic vessel endothelial hyaluronic acid receptor 1a [Thalassophryne amazonica]|uniref:lymphatic vessel endothelial hyaluronic acid receptor 1a n=1 Tax=Thalassophryne amazonica TaxID=390379 RepID=UPI001471D6FB|nr:lymphatic vessel endothelial hyaluronic acid receptor 1a [Thalassophryne amazonica]